MLGEMGMEMAKMEVKADTHHNSYFSDDHLEVYSFELC